jgi:ATP-binding cassette subfamily C protein
LLGVVVAVAALATRRLYRVLAEVVETTRDGVLTETARGTVTRLASTGRGGSGGLAQVVDQTEQTRNLLAALLRALRHSVSPLVAALVGLAMLDVRLAAAVAVPVAVSVALEWRLLAAARTAHRSTVLAGERLAEEVAAVAEHRDSVAGIGAQEWAGDQLDADADAIRRANLRMARVQVGQRLALSLGIHLPLLAVLVLAARLVRSDGLSAGSVVGAATYVLTALAPALSSMVTGTGGWVVQLMVVLDRLARVADHRAPVPASVASLPAAPGTGRAVLLRAAGLGYAHRPSSRPVLEDLHLTLTEGELVAVVGPSGAGKSTLAALLAGVLTPTAGEVALAEGTRTLLLPQDPFVFAGSLRENLDCLAEGVGEAELLAAVHAFGLEDLGGMDVCLRPGGGGLTSAQRQRVVLARALLSGAQVLVLDEATCHLGAEEEARLERLLRDQGRSLVVVAHRFDVLARADRVVRFQGGGTEVVPGGRSAGVAADGFYR